MDFFIKSTSQQELILDPIWHTNPDKAIKHPQLQNAYKKVHKIINNTPADKRWKLLYQEAEKNIESAIIMMIWPKCHKMFITDTLETNIIPRVIKQKWLKTKHETDFLLKNSSTIAYLHNLTITHPVLLQWMIHDEDILQTWIQYNQNKTSIYQPHSQFYKAPPILVLLKILIITILAGTSFYFIFLALLTIPALQNHVIYLHKLKLTWFKDINIPEQFGFLPNQVTPFYLTTPDNESLHTWHILPLDTYQNNEKALMNESKYLHQDINSRLAFKLLKNDPSSQLVIYLHGAAGTLGSGWRPLSYRALSAAAHNVHIIAIDYRGFGMSTGSPSESGLLTDALTLVNFAIQTIGLPPERIIIFGQSLGTAVGISLAHHLSLQSPPTLFAGIVLVAPFANVEMLTETYSIAGMIPLLSPIAQIPNALSFFNKFIISKWPSKDKLSALIQHYENLQLSDRGKKYDITIIHAKDDYDIPWIHSDVLFRHAVNATLSIHDKNFGSLDEKIPKAILEAAVWKTEWLTKSGTLTKLIVQHGLHDRIMSYPIVSLAVAKIFNRQEKNISSKNSTDHANKLSV